MPSRSSRAGECASAFELSRLRLRSRCRSRTPRLRPMEQRVVPLPQRSYAPRQWNLWDLEAPRPGGGPGAPRASRRVGVPLRPPPPVRERGRRAPDRVRLARAGVVRRTARAPAEQVSPAALQRQAALVGAALLPCSSSSSSTSGGTSRRSPHRRSRRPSGKPRRWASSGVPASAIRPPAARRSPRRLWESPIPVFRAASTSSSPTKAARSAPRSSSAGRSGPDSDFALSPALADDLGITTATEIRWRFAG